MSPLGVASQVSRSLIRAYRLTCAREDARNLRLQAPLGVWFCDRCRLVMFDRLGWRDHPAPCTR
jgi:hypothetical protein